MTAVRGFWHPSSGRRQITYAADRGQYGVFRHDRSEILFVEDGLEKFALSPRKNQVSGFGQAPWLAGSGGGGGRFLGRVQAINARWASQLRGRSKGLTARGILLQYTRVFLDLSRGDVGDVQVPEKRDQVNAPSSVLAVHISLVACPWVMMSHSRR